MNLDKQKIWIIGAVVLSGVTAYSFYHSWNCDKDHCLICKSSNGLACITGIVVGIAAVSWIKS